MHAMALVGIVSQMIWASPNSGAAEIRSHRGNLWGHPEHTIESYHDVMKAGVQVVEMDVQLSKDGVPVCIHDATLDRTTNRSGLVSEHDLSELGLADAGVNSHPAFAGRRIPTLQAALEFMKNRRAKAMIEPKVNATAAIVQAVEAAGFPDDRVALLLYTPGALTITAALQEYRNLKPQWEYWMVTAGTPTSIGESVLAAHKAAGWDGLSFWPNTFTAADFALAHRLGLKVGVYGVDATNVLAYVRDGADLLLTDNPGRLSSSLMEGYITAAFDEFAQRYGIPSALRGHTDDPDNDGLTNRDEFAHHTNPMLADLLPLASMPVMHSATEGEHAIIAVTMPPHPMESMWISLQQSADLVTWHPADAALVQEDHSRWPADPAWRFRINLRDSASPVRAFFRAAPHFYPQP